MNTDGASIRDLAESLTTMTPQMQAQIKAAVAANFRSIWASQGMTINQRWGVTLVKTGALRSYMTSTSGITIDRDSITKQIQPTYGQYVNDRYKFAGWSEDTIRTITRIYGARQ